MKMQLIKEMLGFAKKEKDSTDFLESSPIIEQVEYERMVYLETFAKELESLDHRHFEYRTEVVVNLGNKKKIEPFKLIRIDAIHHDGDNTRHEEANIANPAGFEPIKELWDDIEVTLHPIVWNAVDFNVTGDFPNVEQLENWYKKWFDIKGRHKPDDKKLHQVVHKMTMPVKTEDGWTLTVDFGSADMEAFIALFKQCRFNWASAIEISSKQYFSQLSEAYSLTNNTNNVTVITDAQPM
jgi:hypothetical protein